MRVKFEKGKQRKFLQRVLINSNSPSLNELSNRLGMKYSTLKNYFSEVRLLPGDLFKELCFLAKLDFEKFGVVFLEENWGKSLGGRKSRKSHR